jgi:hypothetical protein
VQHRRKKNRLFSRQQIFDALHFHFGAGDHPGHAIAASGYHLAFAGFPDPLVTSRANVLGFQKAVRLSSDAVENLEPLFFAEPVIGPLVPDGPLSVFQALGVA